MNLINALHNKVGSLYSSLNNSLRDTSDHITRLNDNKLQSMYGVIDTLLVKEDSVYALIKKLPMFTVDDTGEQVDDGGDGFFNVAEGLKVHGLTHDEVFIKTNLSAINLNMERYKGKRCKVILRNNIGIYAEIDEGSDSLTVFPAEMLITLRNNDPNFDLFSPINLEVFYKAGYSEQEVEELKKFTYDEKMHNKILAFKDNALWMNDTSKPKDGQIFLDSLGIVKGLSNIAQGKSKNCHFPVSIFSGK